MEENESLGTETESDASTGASSDASEGQGAGETSQEAAPKQTQEPNIDWSKAFEHPRFKELIDQKNSALESSKALQAKIAELEGKVNQPREPQGPSKEQTELASLIEDLKKVDPRLAAQIEAASKASSSVQALQAKLDKFEQAQAETQRTSTIRAAVAEVNGLHESNKVSPELKQLLNDKIDLLFSQGKLNFSDIKGTYSKELEVYTKMFDAIKRTERESYVADKKKDSQVPTSQPKGAPAKSAPPKQTWSADRETRNAQIVSRFLKQSAAEKEAGG